MKIIAFLFAACSVKVFGCRPRTNAHSDGRRPKTFTEADGTAGIEQCEFTTPQSGAAGAANVAGGSAGFWILEGSTFGGCVVR